MSVGGGGRGSGNRKYTQLTVDQLDVLLRVMNLGWMQLPETDENHTDRLTLVNAVAELINKARNTHDPRICLANAVARGAK